MTIRRIKVDATQASYGMYVSQLDRPWLETPFIFQGFEIRERAEIEMLQAYCSYVYIDVDRGSLDPAQVRQLVAMQPAGKAAQAGGGDRPAREPNKWLLRLRSWLSSRRIIEQPKAAARPDAAGYPVRATVRGEAASARDAFESLAAHNRALREQAATRGAVDMRKLQLAVRPMIDSVLRNPDAMAWTVFSRKRNKREYSRAVATSVWCTLFGRQLGLERAELEELAAGGLLLDIGYVRLPDSIAEAVGDLSPEQFRHQQLHVQHGLDILDASGRIPQTVRDMVACHHERADGSGYPEGLIGVRIPPFGRIAAIADSYDAMTTETDYSPAKAAYDAARELNEQRGKTFAADVVEQFLQTVGMFPTASIVELSDGSVGIVLEQNRDNALRPKVLLLLDRDKQPVQKKQVLEMRSLPLDATHARALWISRGHEHGAFDIDPHTLFG